MSTTQHKSPKKIIAGIIEQKGKVLIAQRAKKDALEGKWEFPGGKMEPGETEQETLKRELFEEFGIVAQIGDYICTIPFEYNNSPAEMIVFRVSSFKGDIQLYEHKAIYWALPHELTKFEFPDPDLPIIDLLMQQSKLSNL